MKPLKITFMTTLGVNVGDEFIRAGVRAMLDAVGVAYEPFYVCKHDLDTLVRGVEDETGFIGDKFLNCDVLIQTGAPVYWKNKDGNSSLTSVWYDELWKDRIFKYDKPMFINLGGGSCFAWGNKGEDYLSDGPCKEYAKAAFDRAALTVVRDPVAYHIAETVGSADRLRALACPAYFASSYVKASPRRRGLIGVNLMALGCHHDMGGDFPTEDWNARQIPELLKALRARGRLLFIAHDQVEKDFMLPHAEPGERVFLAPSWRDYLDVYSQCQYVVANRVHGAIAAAGFGANAVILGNDTRAEIGTYCDVPFFRAGFYDIKQVTHSLFEHVDIKDKMFANMMTFNRYVGELRKLIL